MNRTVERLKKLAASARRPEGGSFIDFIKCQVKLHLGEHSLIKSSPQVKQWAEDRLNRVYHSPRSVTKAAMGETGGAAGGYIVPPAFTYEMLVTVAEESIIYPRAHVIPMPSSTMQAPLFDAETVPSSGISPFFGQLTFTWGFSQAPAESEPKFRQQELTAWDLIGYGTMSLQWLMDTGPEGEAYLIEAFGKAAAWYADFAFFQGLGAANRMPLGFLNSPCLKVPARVGAGHLAAGDVANLAAGLLPSSWSNAIWCCSPTAFADIVKISSYFINDGGQHFPGAAGLMIGRPVYITEKLPALGTKGDLCLIDPSLYVVGDRMQVVVDVSPQSPNAWVKNQVDYRVWLRLDGRPMFNNLVTLQDTSTTVSPFVAVPT